MAALEKIRSKAVLLVVVVGVALFAFIIGDFLNSGSTFFNQKKENIVVVNGEAVHYQDYQAKVEERTNAIKMRSGNTGLTDDEQNQIRQMVLDEIINDILFSEQTEKLGLVVNKTELADLVMGNNISPVLQQIPDFQNQMTGQFDKSLLLRFLQMIESDNYDEYPEEYIAQIMEMKQAWLTVEQQIIKDQLRRKFNTLISSSILVNELEAKANFEANKVSVDFDYVSQAYSSISDDEVTVSDAEIQKLYNQHKDLYKQEEAKIINYITVNILPSPSDYSAIETKLEGLRENLSVSANVAEIVQNNSEIPYIDAYQAYTSLDENLKQFVSTNPVGSIDGPILMNDTYYLYKIEGEKTAADSINLNVLMMPMTFDEADLKNLTDSLIQVIKEGTSFADMALAATNGQITGEMGWVTESELVAQVDSKFKDELFAANVKLNEPFIAKSNAGSFLVQVTERTSPVKKYKLATIQAKVVPSQETKTRLYNEFSQFVAANHSLEGLKENAASAGYIIRTDVEIVESQMNIGGIQNTRQIVQWAFNNKKGAISDILECQNNEYFVLAAIEGSLSKGYRPLASVSDILKRELLDEKKGEKIVADLKAKNFTTLEQYAEALNMTPQSVRFVSFGTTNITGIGIEPILNAKAPLASVNEVSGPYAGKNRAYVFSVTDKRENETQVYDSEVQKRQMQMQNTYRMYQLTQSPEILRENAKIDNNFGRFF